MSEKEKKYRKIGWISSIGTQVVMLILFYFLIAWKEPFPPIPSYGIELSFGIENTGTGEEPITNPEPEATETEEPIEESEAAASDPAENGMEEAASDPVETDETPLTETPSPDVAEAETQAETSTEDLPVKAEEPALESEPEEVSKKKENKPVNTEATMPPASSTAETNTTRGTTDDAGSEGREEGTIDGRALMGEVGAADGASLNMSGWIWDFKPQPKDESSESGKIVYSIKVDSDGYLIGIELVSSSVSPVVERYYRQSVERLSFSKTGDYKSAPTSTGTVTFIIRAR